MTGKFELYNIASLISLSRGIFGAGRNGKVVLVSSSYVPNKKDHVSISQSVEAYVVMGTMKSLAGYDSQTISTGIAYWNEPDIVWENLSASFAHAVVFEGDHGTLIGYITFNNGSNITVSGQDFILSFPDSGHLVRVRGL